MKTVKVFRKNVPLVALLFLALTLGGGLTSAALLTFFGQITATATVEQAVLVDEQIHTETISESFEAAVGGQWILTTHYLESQTNVSVDLIFETLIDPDDGGVEVSYLNSTGIEETVETIETQGIPIDITVKDLGYAVQWTFNFLAHTGEAEGNGKFGCALIISFDGETPAFQIHNNDGTCSQWGWGTWLYSEYDTNGGGYYGWHTDEAEWNTLVDQIDWISAEGDMYFVNNEDGILTITIDKTKLDATFYWAAYASIAHFETIPYSISVYPDGFAWDSPKFDSLTVLEPIVEPFTLLPKQRLDFYIRYKFANNAYGDYTITTKVKPS